MDSATIERSANEITDFNIAEYAIGRVENRHHFSRINRKIDVDKNQQVYLSYFLHSEKLIEHYNSTKTEEGKNTLSSYVGCVYANELKIDIDEKESSLSEVRKLLQYWESSYELDTRYIKINFSGSKGFHIRIPAELFGGFEPSERLPAIHKQIALELTQGVKIDESVYRTTGLFRAVNSINNKSGLFAVPLSLDEVLKCSYDEIKELAKGQRQVEYIDADELIEMEGFVELKENAKKSAQTSATIIKPNKSFWASADEGNRFETLTSAVGRLIRTNLSNEDIFQLGLMINSQHNPPKDEKIVSRQITDLLNKFGDVEGDFWNIKRKIDKNDRTKVDVSIDLNKYIKFLNREGFGKIYLDKSPLFIKTENKIIKETSVPQIKDYVMGYVQNIGLKENPYREDLTNKLLGGVSTYFKETLLECVNTEELSLQKDTRDTAFIYFRNGYVTVRKDKVPVISQLSELESPIWESSIIERDFTLLQNKERLSEFEQFLRNVVRNDEDRFLSLCSAIGYLLHGFKDESNAKAVILCDERISDQPNGRSGKSLVAKAIGKVKKVTNIDGKNFEFGSRFTFQSVNLDTKVIDFNDVKKEFDFEKLFSVLTDDMNLEYKNQNPINISFEDSPKIMLSTNYTIKGNSGSYQDRMLEIEFSDHYNENHKPVDEFGHLFFQDWDDEEWNRFDNFMLECLQLFLDNGVIKSEPINLVERKLQDQTSPEFVDFIREEVIIGLEYDLKDLYEDFKKYIGYGIGVFEVCPIKQNTFSGWLKNYADFNRLKYHKRPSNGRQYITLSEN